MMRKTDHLSPIINALLGFKPLDFNTSSTAIFEGFPTTTGSRPLAVSIALTKDPAPKYKKLRVFN